MCDMCECVRICVSMCGCEHLYSTVEAIVQQLVVSQTAKQSKHMEVFVPGAKLS